MDTHPYRVPPAVVEADMTARAQRIEINRTGTRAALTVDGIPLDLGDLALDSFGIEYADLTNPYWDGRSEVCLTIKADLIEITAGPDPRAVHVTWPDLLAHASAFLTPILDPVTVASRVPQDEAPRLPLVQLRRAGGTARPPGPRSAPPRRVVLGRDRHGRRGDRRRRAHRGLGAGRDRTARPGRLHRHRTPRPHPGRRPALRHAPHMGDI